MDMVSEQSLGCSPGAHHPHPACSEPDGEVLDIAGQGAPQLHAMAGADPDGILAHRVRLLDLGDTNAPRLNCGDQLFVRPNATT
jgi:hypothetical protein